MNLADALDRALAARYPWGEPKSPATSWRGLHARMGRLERALAVKGERTSASRARAARAAGIGPSTWDFWRAKKRHPSAASLRKLEGAFARLVAAPHLAAAIERKPLPRGMNIKAVVNWGNSAGSKYVGGENPNGTPKNLNRAHRMVKLRDPRDFSMRDVMTAWANFGGEAAAQALEASVKRRLKQDVYFEEHPPRHGVTVELVNR